MYVGTDLIKITGLLLIGLFLEYFALKSICPAGGCCSPPREGVSAFWILRNLLCGS